MGLTSADRGILDQLLDNSINNAKRNLKFFSSDLIKQGFQLNNIEEFVFGIEYGTITQAYSNYFNSIHFRIPTPEEGDEITQVVLKRLPEIKKAIYFSE
jgi:hypothetical protein